ncbi:hypothetical protein NPIL_235941, partial [Nephila pilipes]
MNGTVSKLLGEFGWKLTNNELTANMSIDNYKKNNDQLSEQLEDIDEV